MQKPLEELNRLKNKYFLFATNIKNIANFKQKIWDNNKKEYFEKKEVLEEFKNYDTLKFIQKIILKIDNVYLNKQLAIFFKSKVYSNQGKMNPLINLSDFIFS